TEVVGDLQTLRVADAMQSPTTRLDRALHVEPQAVLPEHELRTGSQARVTVDRRQTDVRGRAVEHDHARPPLGRLDAHVEVAYVFAGDHDVVVEVPPDRHAAGQRKARVDVIEQNEGVTRVAHSMRYCTLQSSAPAPNFSSPVPRTGSASRRTNCARVSSAACTKL